MIDSMFKTSSAKRMKIVTDIPLVIFSAVYLAILLEAGRLILQLGPALGALEAGGVPLLLHGAEVILVSDPDPAAGAQRRLAALAPRLAGLDLHKMIWFSPVARASKSNKAHSQIGYESNTGNIRWQ